MKERDKMIEKLVDAYEAGVEDLASEFTPGDVNTLLAKYAKTRASWFVSNGKAKDRKAAADARSKKLDAMIAAAQGGDEAAQATLDTYGVEWRKRA